ncbi:MAG: CPBP family intramembrane metalloprotease [Anaerolineales bacterium]|jgi:membrane protease YdiL (CAAX protease family)
MMNTNTPFVKRHSLVLFFVLAYTISWIIFILAATLPNFPFLFPLGPLLAAFIVASLTGGLKDLLSRLLRWRAGIQWYAAALLVGPAIGLVAVYLNVLLGAPVPTAALVGSWYGLFLLFPGALLDAPFWEETGWRGFALPRFAANRSPLANSLILGALVVGWHVPLVLFEPALAAPYLIGALASAVMTNWVYYNTRGSALLPMLYHTAANTVGIYFGPALSGPDLVRYQWLLAGLTIVAAVVVVLVTGPALQRQPKRPVQPAPAV